MRSSTLPLFVAAAYHCGAICLFAMVPLSSVESVAMSMVQLIVNKGTNILYSHFIQVKLSEAALCILQQKDDTALYCRTNLKPSRPWIH